MLSVAVLNVVMLSGVMLNVVEQNLQESISQKVFSLLLTLQTNKLECLPYISI
jgi:hypothetical protein